jgi:hypothetical protein
MIGGGVRPRSPEEAPVFQVVPMVEWGPVAVWAGAVATVLAVVVAILVAVGAFDRFGGPRLVLTFESGEPWTRVGRRETDRALWVRVGVENGGSRPARGCVGRMMMVSTDGRRRRDIDPLQLRWAGVPLSRAFDPVDLRRGQREYLDVLLLAQSRPWRILTFEDPDFDPGFSTELDRGHEHVLDLAVFTDNAETVARSLVVSAPEVGEEVQLYLR